MTEQRYQETLATLERVHGALHDLIEDLTVDALRALRAEALEILLTLECELDNRPEAQN